MSTLLSKAHFLRSASAEKDFPGDIGAEIAFCGRSNAGKSSAINTLCRQNSLARTSKTPGRTQLINFFKLDGDSCLVDLPGYGYAKAPAKIQQKWQQLMKDYLMYREPLCGLILLMKADKVNRNHTVKAMTQVSAKLEEKGFDCGIQAFSATKQIGLSQAQNKITSWLDSALTEE